MKKNTTEKISNNLVNAFLKNKIISPLPKRYTKKLIDEKKHYRKNKQQFSKCFFKK